MNNALAFDPSQPWDRALLALALSAVDPALGGIHIRARSGPVRRKFQDQFMPFLGTLVSLHPTMTDDQLFGGLDLTATLSAGRLVQQTGVLARSGTWVLTMAERASTHLAARLALALDTQAERSLILLDEGADGDEIAPQSLTERLAFWVDFEAVAIGDTKGKLPGIECVDAARNRLPYVECGDDLVEAVTSVCVRLGVNSLRGPLLTVRASRAIAALQGRDSIESSDVEMAISLVLAHRARQLPQDTDAAQEPESPENEPSDECVDPEEIVPPDDLLLEAALAMLPADFLAKVAGRSQKGAKGSGSGAKRKGNRRGRPVPSRPGRLDGKSKLDLVATLRAAAPWQKMRQKDGVEKLRIHASDVFVKRFETLSDRLLIFAVDASGSAAMARLAEAKGAVELLLGQAYARRDHVAMIAFRGADAEILLPPTRSLVQAKKRLAGLPGGGGTPLAAGLKMAGEVAVQARQRGLTPTVVLLTDGRANITLDGTPGRPKAASDSQGMARALAEYGVDALVIDTGARPEASLRDLAQILSAPYLAMPRADSARLSQAVSATLAD